jgi:hypothetical protein
MFFDPDKRREKTLRNWKPYDHLKGTYAFRALESRGSLQSIETDIKRMFGVVAWESRSMPPDVAARILASNLEAVAKFADAFHVEKDTVELFKLRSAIARAHLFFETYEHMDHLRPTLEIGIAACTRAQTIPAEIAFLLAKKLAQYRASRTLTQEELILLRDAAVRSPNRESFAAADQIQRLIIAPTPKREAKPRKSAA